MFFCALVLLGIELARASVALTLAVRPMIRICSFQSHCCIAPSQTFVTLALVFFVCCRCLLSSLVVAVIVADSLFTGPIANVCAKDTGGVPGSLAYKSAIQVVRQIDRRAGSRATTAYIRGLRGIAGLHG